MELSEIISRCRRNNRSAQNFLFERYAPIFKSICMRYMSSEDIAEDVLIQAFYKIFIKIRTFKHEGSFEGWMKRIVINECLMELRKTKNLSLTVPMNEEVGEWKVEMRDNLEYEELLKLLKELPSGYRTVFNMYVIEGYKHREIAEKLGISINTSKSQLILAKRKLQQLIKKKWTSKIA